MATENDDRIAYMAIMNHEEQYSLWQANRDVPLGWKDAGKRGTKAECLTYIKQMWTDMRPLGLRQKVDQTEKVTSQKL